jgi:protein-S-isoprenylcysteine O-methyltransferase Ste14
MDASWLPSLGPRGEGWVALQAVLGAAIVVVGPVAGGAWSGPAATVATAAGLILLVGGGMLTIRGMLDLGAGLTPLPRPREGAVLMEHGAYALCRHPIYGGQVLAAAGWSLVLASPAALLLSVFLLGFFDLKSRREERWLVERYPGYPAYQARTKRLIPFIH